VPAEILKVSAAEVHLGFNQTDLATPPTHPGTKKLIERTLSSVAGCKVQVYYEIIQTSELIAAR